MNINMCRLCMGTEALTNIFEKRGSKLLSSLITNLADIRINPTDGLPSKICKLCTKKLDNCINFIHVCQDSDRKLRLLQKNNDDKDSQIELEIYDDNDTNLLDIKIEHNTKNNIEQDNESENSELTGIVIVKKSKSSQATKSGNKALKNGQVKSKTVKKPVKQQCFTCGKIISSRFRLMNHMRIHTGERPFACTECDKTFTTRQSRKVHMRIHTGEKPYKCPLCNDSFAQSSALREHKKKHTGQKPYSCEVCDRRFRSNGHYQYHKRLHTGEKNFECDICAKAFITRSALNQHLSTHTGDRPHMCPICGKRMSRAFHIKRHMQQAHQEQSKQQAPDKSKLDCIHNDSIPSQGRRQGGAAAPPPPLEIKKSSS